MQLSRYFSLDELTRSQTAARKGIDNTASAEILENLKELAQSLDRVRDLLGHPVHVDSGYRCPKLNAAVGGKPESAHLLGWAADILCHDFGTPSEVFEAIHESDIDFDKLIIECPNSVGGGWVHISFDPAMRRVSLLTADGNNFQAVG